MADGPDLGVANDYAETSGDNTVALSVGPRFGDAQKLAVKQRPTAGLAPSSPFDKRSSVCRTDL